MQTRQQFAEVLRHWIWIEMESIVSCRQNSPVLYLPRRYETNDTSELKYRTGFPILGADLLLATSTSLDTRVLDYDSYLTNTAHGSPLDLDSTQVRKLQSLMKSMQNLSDKINTVLGH